MGLKVLLPMGMTAHPETAFRTKEVTGCAVLRIEWRQASLTLFSRQTIRVSRFYTPNYELLELIGHLNLKDRNGEKF